MMHPTPSKRSRTRNSSADAYTSALYPADSRRKKRALRIEASSSTTNTVSRGLLIGSMIAVQLSGIARRRDFKGESGSAVRIVFRPDAPSVFPDDGTAHTQAHPHAGIFRREKR